MKKNVPWHILAPRRGCFGNHLPSRRVRILAERFLSYRNEVSYTIKKRLPQVRQPLNFQQQSVRRSYILLFFIFFSGSKAESLFRLQSLNPFDRFFCIFMCSEASQAEIPFAACTES